MADVYKAVDCSLCHEKDIKWGRFECLVCTDYNLCRKCYDGEQYGGSHRLYHPTQQVLDKEAFFELTKSILKPEDDVDLCCPLCGQRKVGLAKLLQHCLLKHPVDADRIKCPVCVTFCIPQSQDSVFLYKGITNHLQRHHTERGLAFFCDTCDKAPITRNRYMCLICDEYGQCDDCFKGKRLDKKHLPYHPVQVVLPKEDYVAQNPLRETIYRCPFCGEPDFSATDLTNHCHELHLNCRELRVICPICAVCRLPFAEYSLLKDSFVDHLENYHGLLPTGLKPKSGPNECVICLLELAHPSGEYYFRCLHNNFHDQCIQKWLSTNPTCPVCRVCRANRAFCRVLLE